MFVTDLVPLNGVEIINKYLNCSDRLVSMVEWSSLYQYSQANLNCSIKMIGNWYL